VSERTYVHQAHHDPDGRLRPTSWHVVLTHTRAINGWKTLCGRYLETTDTMSVLPSARSCESCLRIAARNEDRDS
jgi:hypothetical protein